MDLGGFGGTLFSGKCKSSWAFGWKHLSGFLVGLSVAEYSEKHVGEIDIIYPWPSRLCWQGCSSPSIINRLHAADIHNSSLSHTISYCNAFTSQFSEKTQDITVFTLFSLFRGGLAPRIDALPGCIPGMLQVLIFSGSTLVGGSHPRGNPLAPQCSGDGIDGAGFWWAGPPFEKGEPGESPKL